MTEFNNTLDVNLTEALRNAEEVRAQTATASVTTNPEPTVPLYTDSPTTGASTQPLRPQIPKDDDFVLEVNPDGPGLVVNTADLEEKEAVKPSVLGAEFGDNINEYMAEMDAEIEEAKKAAEVVKEQKEAEAEEDEEAEVDPEELERELNDKFNQAIVIIDKMNAGTTINFTDEEREKLEHVRKIRLEEVETVSIKSIKRKKSKKQNLDSILKRQKSVHSVPVILPISGYTAVLKGCSTYELISLMGGSQNALLDTEAKWTLLHDKLESTSLGMMNFNDFLRATAANDYNMMIYGLLCATYPDDDKIPLKCQEDKCRKEHDHHYSVKSLLRAEKMSDKLRETIVNVIDNSHTKEAAQIVHDKSAVQQVKEIQLPVSGIILELYIQSAHELLYTSIKALNENEEEKYNQAAVLSTVVKSAYVPDPDEDESYFEYTNAIDVTKIIYSLTDTDILTLSRQSELLLDDLNVEFGLMNIKCPHCGHYRETLAFDIETILFYRYQQAMSTTVE